MINFAGVLEHHAALRPDRTAIAWRGGRRSYRELSDRASALAASLLRRGIGRGSVVAILLRNRVEFIESISAIARIGAVFLPINLRLAGAEWRYILEHSGASAVVTEADFESALLAACEGLGIGTRISCAAAPHPGFEAFDALIAEGAGERVPVEDVAEDALQRLMYTSGTTARPKGVRITHAAFSWKCLGLLVEFGWTDAEVTVVGGPLYHVGALDMGGLTTLYAGGSLVMQPRFDAEDLLALIEEHAGTNCWLAPAMVNALLQTPSLTERDLGSLRLILSGGEKMPESRLRQILDALPHVWFADAYGSTETVSSDTFVDREHMTSKLGSVGRPIPHLQIRIVDELGAPVEAGALGEITVRGPKVFAGYWRDEEATAAALRDGWYFTGDMGRVDADGFLYVEDRKKDMIVSGGENIASPEVERALFEHPAVHEAAVVKGPDERWGEVPVAYVALKPGAAATPDELTAFCAERLAGFKVPRHIEFVDELPRTSSGKVLKRALRDDFSARRA